MNDYQTYAPSKFQPEAQASDAAVQRILATHGTKIWPVALLSALAGAGLFTAPFMLFRLL